MINSETPLDIDLIKECMDELKPLDDRKEFLYQQTKKKLDIYNKEYLDDFSNTVDKLYEHAVNGNVKGIGVYISRLTKMSLSITKIELAIYKYLCSIGGEQNDN